MEKTLNSRIINKHDLEVNWLKAINFVPKQGELIVYDVDDKYTYQRFKIGDGVTKINDLPFIAKSDWNAKEGTAGYIENRTHYIGTLEIEWDGVIDGHLATESHTFMSGAKFVKVSDFKITEQHQPIQLLVDCGEQIGIQTFYNACLFKEDGSVSICEDLAYYVPEDNFVIEPELSHHNRVVFPEKGLYFIYNITPDGTVQFGKTLLANDIHQLDTKYIPNDIARVSQLKDFVTESYVDEKIETIEIPVNSVNGKTGEVVLTANDIGAMKATDPTGTGSLSVNRLARTNIGSNSCAIGNSTRAQGNSSCAMGYYTQADGDYSFAMGRQAYARGKSSVAFGDNNIAIGNYSYTEGSGLSSGISLTGEANTKIYTYGESSFVESRITEGLFVSYKNSYAQIIQLDKDNRVITLTSSLSSEALNATTVTIFLGGASVGTNSHVEGECTTAGGDYSHSEGEYTIAGSKGQHVQGRYNITDISNTHAHIVGNGRSYSQRSNAHTLDWDGNAWYSGDVYVGSTSGIDKDEGSKKLATEDYVNESLVAITLERITEICGIEPVMAFAVNDEGDALVNAGWPDDNGNIQI